MMQVRGRLKFSCQDKICCRRWEHPFIPLLMAFLVYEYVHNYMDWEYGLLHSGDMSTEGSPSAGYTTTGM